MTNVPEKTPEQMADISISFCFGIADEMLEFLSDSFPLFLHHRRSKTRRLMAKAASHQSCHPWGVPFHFLRGGNPPVEFPRDGADCVIPQLELVTANKKP